jgi:hypothetical protein
MSAAQISLARPDMIDKELHLNEHIADPPERRLSVNERRELN